MREVLLPTVVTFRVDETTKIKIEAAAAARGMSVGTLCRNIVVQECGAREAAGVAADNRNELRKLLGELGRIGNNLNQTARHLHTGGAASSDLSSMRASLEACLADVIAAVGGGRRR